MIIIECVCVRWHVQQVACCCYLKCRIERGQLAQPWCVCVRVCVDNLFQTCTHTHINTHTQTHTHAYKYIHTQTHTHTHTNTCTYTRIRTHIQTHIHTWDQSSGALFVVKCKEMRKIRHDSSNHFYSYTA